MATAISMNYVILLHTKKKTNLHFHRKKTAVWTNGVLKRSATRRRRKRVRMTRKNPPIFRRVCTHFPINFWKRKKWFICLIKAKVGYLNGIFMIIFFDGRWRRCYVFRSIFVRSIWLRWSYIISLATALAVASTYTQHKHSPYWIIILDLAFFSLFPTKWKRRRFLSIFS